MFYQLLKKENSDLLEELNPIKEYYFNVNKEKSIKYLIKINFICWKNIKYQFIFLLFGLF